MADEAVLIFETSPALPFTVVDGTGIEKGTQLKLTDGMTAIKCTAAGDMWAGIAASEKIAGNGKTKLGVYRGGIFKMTLSGTVNVGGALAVAASANHSNEVKQAPFTLSGGQTVGIALEAGTNAETILVELRPGVECSVS